MAFCRQVDICWVLHDMQLNMVFCKLLYFACDLAKSVSRIHFAPPFKQLFLLQFLMDSPEIWTVHSPICNLHAWHIINSIVVLFQNHVLGFWGDFCESTALADAEHHRIALYCVCTSPDTISRYSEQFMSFGGHPIEWQLLYSAWHSLLFMASCWMQQFSFNWMFTKLNKLFLAPRDSIRANACTV